MTITLDPSQEAAVELVLSARIGVVTGGPGTGKTTILRAALDRIEQMPAPPLPADYDGFSEPRPRYLLASPTGKAAKRMSEATGREARTVHRLLEYGREGFGRTAQRPLETELVIVDEASMLDIELAAALTAAIDPAQARLILVGDANQLPSVGPGRVFGDLIDSGAVPVARLTTLHRSARESWVCRNAARVLAGHAPELEQRKDFVFLPAETRDDAARKTIARSLELDDEDVEHQVLTPQNTGPAGADALNASLQAHLNPPRSGELAWGKAPHALRLRDRVIQSSNNYNLRVFNGEVGRVTALDAEQLTVDFGDRQATYDRDSAQGLRLAYALTIHKSQGSEFPWVVVLCHSTHHFMLSRQLFYTAITRAKVGVVIVGDRKGIEAAVKNAEPAFRNTGLAQRLRGAA